MPKWPAKADQERRDWKEKGNSSMCARLEGRTL